MGNITLRIDHLIFEDATVIFTDECRVNYDVCSSNDTEDGQA